MSIRQARIIKRMRAELEDTRKLLRAYQLLYGKTPQEQYPQIIISGSTATPLPIIPPPDAIGYTMYLNGLPYCPRCQTYYAPGFHACYGRTG